MLEDSLHLLHGLWAGFSGNEVIRAVMLAESLCLLRGLWAGFEGVVHREEEVACTWR